MLVESLRELARARDGLNALQTRIGVVRESIETHGRRLKELYRILSDS